MTAVRQAIPTLKEIQARKSGSHGKKSGSHEEKSGSHEEKSGSHGKRMAHMGRAVPVRVIAIMPATDIPRPGNVL